MKSDLENNLRAFEEALPDLLGKNEGRFAVGKSGDEFKCWDTYTDALQKGYFKYGLDSFIVKRVERIETIHAIYQLGVAAQVILKVFNSGYFMEKEDG